MMEMIDVQVAKKHLSRLIAQAARGEPFVITKAGKPMVKVVPVDAFVRDRPRRIGFMAGQIKVPDCFDRMGQREIDRLFYGKSSS